MSSFLVPIQNLIFFSELFCFCTPFFGKRKGYLKKGASFKIMLFMVLQDSYLLGIIQNLKFFLDIERISFFRTLFPNTFLEIKSVLKKKSLLLQNSALYGASTSFSFLVVFSWIPPSFLQASFKYYGNSKEKKRNLSI